jgi:hypothetical protein
MSKFLSTPRMYYGIRGTSRRYSGGFAKKAAGYVEKDEVPTLLQDRLEIRLDKNFDGFLAQINLGTNGRVAEIDLV